MTLMSNYLSCGIDIRISMRGIIVANTTISIGGRTPSRYVDVLRGGPGADNVSICGVQQPERAVWRKSVEKDGKPGVEIRRPENVLKSR
jgi:hypothetical protein